MLSEFTASSVGCAQPPTCAPQMSCMAGDASAQTSACAAGALQCRGELGALSFHETASLASPSPALCTNLQCALGKAVCDGAGGSGVQQLWQHANPQALLQQELLHPAP